MVTQPSQQRTRITKPKPSTKKIKQLAMLASKSDNKITYFKTEEDSSRNIESNIHNAHINRDIPYLNSDTNLLPPTRKLSIGMSQLVRLSFRFFTVNRERTKR